VVFGGSSDTGQRREHNEDAWKGDPLGTGVLLVVCDGVGGAKAGEVASKLAVDGIHASLQARVAAEPPPEDRRPWLDGIAREVDRRIREAAQQPGLSGMGATLSALWLDGARGWWAQAGDSRIYRLRGGELRQLTCDQSPVGRMRAQGQLSEVEARKHPYRHMIDQCLGGVGAMVEPDTGELDVLPRDVFLLCSDGLSDGLWDRELAEGLAAAANGTPPDEVASTLVARANAASGTDNITAVVARVNGVPGAAMPGPEKAGGITTPLTGFLRRMGFGGK
jgi:protein phosphatase